MCAWAIVYCLFTADREKPGRSQTATLFFSLLAFSARGDSCMRLRWPGLILFRRTVMTPAGQRSTTRTVRRAKTAMQTCSYHRLSQRCRRSVMSSKLSCWIAMPRLVEERALWLEGLPRKYVKVRGKERGDAHDASSAENRLRLSQCGELPLTTSVSLVAAQAQLPAALLALMPAAKTMLMLL